MRNFSFIRGIESEFFFLLVKLRKLNTSIFLRSFSYLKTGLLSSRLSLCHDGVLNVLYYRKSADKKR